MSNIQLYARRGFLKANAALVASVPWCLWGGAAAAEKHEEEEETELTPLEDLAQEHGLVQNILLICREGKRRLESNESAPPSLFADVAGVMRSVVEDHHEPTEEEFVFSRLVRAGRLVNVVSALKEQHRVSRGITDAIRSLAAPDSLGKEESRQEMIRRLGALIRMYEQHAACEDMVVFPEYRRIAGDREYEKTGHEMERREHEQLGAQSIADAVKRVIEIEKLLGIDDVAKFTPA